MQYCDLNSPNYNAKVRLKEGNVSCYSAGYLKNTYPRGGCVVVGEIIGRVREDAADTLKTGDAQYTVFPSGHHSRLFWGTAGYLQVGEHEYVAVLQSRAALLLLLLMLLLAAAVLLLVLLTGRPGGPTVIDPVRPLPPVDSSSEKLEDDTSQKAEVEEGGGSLSMIYSLEAAVTLSTGEVTVYFKNPNASTHNVALDMYILSGDEEYLLAQSGLLEAGYGLSTLQMVPDAPQLSEGVYTGLFRLHCFDPATGVQAIIVPEITGLNITVLH